MKRLAAVLAVVVTVCLASAAWAGVIVTPDTVKWQQLPDMEMETQGDTPSQHQTHGPVSANDWLCGATGPVTDIVWWGSYLNSAVEEQMGSATQVSFELSLHPDLPQNLGSGWDAGFPAQDPNPATYYIEPPTTVVNNMSQPGLFTNEAGVNYYLAQFGTATQTFYGTTPGGENVYMYTVDVNSGSLSTTWTQRTSGGVALGTEVFIQEMGEIYWLDVAYNDWKTSATPVWGWHKAVATELDSSVVNVVPVGADISPHMGPWAKLDCADLAFEVSTPVPEPGTLMLLGGGLLGLAGLRRRFTKK